MERILLFRFHDHLEVCINRLQLLRRLNPDVRMFGLYGGPSSRMLPAQEALGDYLESIWEIPVASTEWKWRHGDLSLIWWFKQVGHKIPFDILHLVEWDLLVLSSLDEIYGTRGLNGVALTGLTPLEKIQHTWWWTAHPPHALEWKQLKHHIQEQYGFKGPYLACQGPANAFSRAFLERYSKEKVPQLAHEELRLPIFAHVLGFEVEPLAHVYREIRDRHEMQFFNCEKLPIQPMTIQQELQNPHGRRVFHPFGAVFPLERL